MINSRYTKKAQTALQIAESIATENGNRAVGTEHLLYGLLMEGTGVAARILYENHIEAEKIKEFITDNIQSKSKIQTLDAPLFTPRASVVLENSYKEAASHKMDKIGTEHILYTMIKDSECVGTRMLSLAGGNLQKIFLDIAQVMGMEVNTARSEYNSIRGKKKKARSATQMLDQFSRDLTELARDGKLDPVIGRIDEIQRMIQILSRRSKNNPCLIGEPGVGKTAVVEGLAQRIIEGSVPGMIKDKRVVTLDLSAMVAGSKYRGEFEERIKKIIKEVTDNGNILLFLDELHTIIGAGGAEGAIDASNILKPSLARGEIQLIGATTREEYRKYIEKDAALERRFQPVVIEEPTEEETVAVLRGIRSKYEIHHKVEITEEALVAAASMAKRYISDRFLPDKAIDLMDEAAAYVRIGTYIRPDNIKELEDTIDTLEVTKEQYISQGKYIEAGHIKKQQIIIGEKLSALREQWKDDMDSKGLVVGEEEIAGIVSKWTKIPVTKIEEKETSRLIHLEDELHKRIVGQEEAIVAVSKAIRRSRVGLKDPKRPIGSFLFLGPTGVGKTELSKALAEAVFGTESNIIWVDMSEYMEKHSVSKMIGSPPGYVGYDDAGQLSEKVRRNPYSVVLFDEIEKAHGDVFNILLQILDEGQVTDGKGRTVDFKNTIIIMTSNAGAKNIIAPKRLGFAAESDDKEDYERMKSKVLDEVKKIFKPEFLNRMDDMIVFHALLKEHIQEITKILLNQLVKRAKLQMDIQLELDDDAVLLIAEDGFDRDYGARPLKRAIQTKIEDKLAEEILEGKYLSGDSVKVSVKDKILQFSKAE